MKKTTHKGFMMVEIVVAASLITVVVLGVMSVAQKSVAVSRQSLHTAEATFLLEEGAEAVRIVRDNGWSNITSLTTGATLYPTFSGGTWTLSSFSNTVGIFTRTVTVASVSRDASSGDIVTSGGTVDAGSRLVTVTVVWQEGGNTVAKTLSFYIMDILS